MFTLLRELRKGRWEEERRQAGRNYDKLYMKVMEIGHWFQCVDSLLFFYIGR
jgi:hypothetical protein